MADIPKVLEQLFQRPVAVFGSGVSGQAVCDLLNRLKVSYRVYDQKESGDLEFEFREEHLEEHDLVVYSPGFSADHEWLKMARRADLRIMGELEFSSLIWKGPLIAVTGTNGKTTVAEFLAFSLKRLGKDAIAVGNNGVPLAKIAANPSFDHVTAVCEVSSFQAESLETFRCDALIWTNFAEDHLDRYGDMRAYARAKWHLVDRLRSSHFIISAQAVEVLDSLGFKLPDYAQVVRLQDFHVWELPKKSAFHIAKQYENLLLVRALWRQFDYSLENLKEGAAVFSGLEHRLRVIGQVNDVSFWNDSKATNFNAAAGAMTNFKKPVIWIGGGKYRGGNIDDLVNTLEESIKAAIVIGEVAESLKVSLESKGIPVEVSPSLQDAVRKAYNYAEPHDDVLFSPGFSSQDGFVDYVARGICYENAVLGLKNSINNP